MRFHIKRMRVRSLALDLKKTCDKNILHENILTPANINSGKGIIKNKITKIHHSFDVSL